VLIVDDNATNREILNTCMTSWGMRVSETEDGPGALNSLYGALDADDPFQVAVIDMQMPGMDGKALGQAIKADERLAKTRMVLLSSLGVCSDAKRFAEIGFKAYLTKPARTLELKAVLLQILGLGEQETLQQNPIAARHKARETMNLFSGYNVRTLLVEDNITNQKVALGILRKLGLSADAVANGAEAIKALESIPYDLVLMDVQMPVMDGYEATAQIRNPRSTVLDHNIPVIAMTANAMAGDREKCLEVGMNDYVSKPVKTHSLAEALEKWLPKHKGNREELHIIPKEEASDDLGTVDLPV
jgi:CheY-like chemotaxis protein